MSPGQTIALVAAHYELDPADLRGPSRLKTTAKARHIAFFLLRKNHGLSLTEIGVLFEGRDHSTVLHGIKKIEGMMGAGNGCSRDVAAIRSKLVERTCGMTTAYWNGFRITAARPDDESDWERIDVAVDDPAEAAEWVRGFFEDELREALEEAERDDEQRAREENAAVRSDDV